MLKAEPDTRSLEEIVASFDEWLKTNYLSNRMNVSSDYVIIYGATGGGFWLRTLTAIFMSVLPITLITSLIFIPEMGLLVKVTEISFISFGWFFLLLAFGRVPKPSVLTINLVKGTIKTEWSAGIFKRKYIASEVKLKEISKLQLWEDRDPYHGLNGFSLDIWINYKKTQLMYFGKGGPYGDPEPYIALQVKNITEAAIREFKERQHKKHGNDESP